MISLYIYSRSIEEHEKHLGIVFQQLRDHHLFLSKSKVDLYSKRSACLSHIIDDQGIHADADKMQCIHEWRCLRTFNDVQCVGCIYAPYKVNPNIFQFYFNFLDIFHHTSMHPLFRNIYEFYSIFYDFISSFIIYNNHLYLRRHFLF